MVTGYTGTIDFSTSDTASGASVPAGYTFPAGTLDDHEFPSGFTFETPGNQSITATDPNGASVYIDFQVTSATHLAFIAPTTVVAGQPYSIGLVPLAQNNYIVGNQSGIAQVTTSDGQAELVSYYQNVYSGLVYDSAFGPGFISDIPFEPTVQSSACDFEVIFKTAGAQTITATDTSFSGFTVTATIDVVPANAASLTVTAPSGATAGTPVSVTVTAKDEYNNIATGYSGSVQFTSTDSGSASVLPSNYTFQPADDGVHVFSSGVKLVTGGGQTVTVASEGNGYPWPVTAGSATVSVGPGATAKFAVSAPGVVGWGGSFPFTVVAEDTFGNATPAYNGTVHFTSSDTNENVILPTNQSLTNGVGTFSATLMTVGTQTITASSGGSSGSAAIAVEPHFAVTLPSSAMAGNSFNFTVKAVDANNGLVSGYSGTVDFASSDGDAVLPVNATITNGVGIFTATLDTTGAQTISATDNNHNVITGTSSNTSVGPGVAASLSIVAPAGVSDAASFSFMVYALDSFGNVATSFNGTVHFSGGGSGAELPGNAALTNGVGTFSAFLPSDGTPTLTAVDTSNSALAGSTNVTVNPVQVSFYVASYDDTGTSGARFTLIVVAYDQFNTIANHYTGTLQFTSSDGSAGLPGSTCLSGGEGSFTVALYTLGSQTITVTGTPIYINNVEWYPFTVR